MLKATKYFNFFFLKGCLNHSEDQKCKCSHGHQNSALPSEILSSEVAWHSIEDNVTLTCHRGFVKYKDQNQEIKKSRFLLKDPSNNVSFDCLNACVEAPYNPETTYAHHIGPITLRFGDNLSIVCKHGHRLVAVKSYQSLPEKRFMEWRKTNLQTLYSGHIQC